jgi:tetratricopeptide (TPR) repeat protein
VRSASWERSHIPRGDYSTARAYLEEALRLEQESGLTERVAGTLSNLALVAKGEGDYDAARILCEEALRIGRDVGDSFLVTSATNNLADLALVEGRYDDAAILSSEGLLMSQRADDTEGIATALMNGGFAALKTGRLRDAKEMLSEAMAAGRRLGSVELIASCIAGCAAIAALNEETVTAVRLLGAVAKLREGAGLAPEKFEAGLEQTTLSSLSVTLGQGALEQALRDGEVLGLEDAIAEALGCPMRRGGPSSLQ